MKNGSSLANTFGSIAVMYSLFGATTSYLRGEDDSYNTLAAATATGMLYKSTGIIKKSEHNEEETRNFKIHKIEYFTH